MKISRKSYLDPHLKRKKLSTETIKRIPVVTKNTLAMKTTKGSREELLIMVVAFKEEEVEAEVEEVVSINE
jgi:hypothetical protein